MTNELQVLVERLRGQLQMTQATNGTSALMIDVQTVMPYLEALLSRPSGEAVDKSSVVLPRADVLQAANLLSNCYDAEDEGCPPLPDEHECGICGIARLEKRLRAALTHPAPQVGEPDELSDVERVRNESGGWWSSCSGCHDTNEGQQFAGTPYSKALGCYLGGGCHECGGIGAIWNMPLEDAAPSVATPICPKCAGPSGMHNQWCRNAPWNLPCAAATPSSGGTGDEPHTASMYATSAEAKAAATPMCQTCNGDKVVSYGESEPGIPYGQMPCPDCAPQSSGVDYEAADGHAQALTAAMDGDWCNAQEVNLARAYQSLRSRPAVEGVCLWYEDGEDSNWASGCGQAFQFNDGTPTENGMKFCFGCGKPLEHALKGGGEK